MNEPTPVSEEPTPNVDRLLRSYYRREMPASWPAPPGEAVTSIASAEQSTWTLMRGRMLVGASLVALVLGYLSVSAFFPRPHPGGLDPNHGQTIGHRPGLDPARPATRPMP